MRRQDLLQILAYILVSLISVGGAFVLSSRFLASSQAQETAEPSQPPPPPPPPTAEEPPSSANPAPDQGTPTPPPAPPPGGTGEKSATSAGIAELEGFLEPFIYDIVNRRDPFQAYAEYVPQEDQGGGGGAPRVLSPAQRFDLEQLRLIGIMWDVKEPKAMFMDPEQEVLVLGRDESIGNRNGYIAAIREGEVVVVEALRKRGDIIYRTKVLRIDR